METNVIGIGAVIFGCVIVGVVWLYLICRKEDKR